ncbi:MAG: Mov34/MPN/PAD-1 family protein [Moraxella sp.]|nr:Mov34/MPN/PAD-1 family protein [Moraxella sp.]
MKLTKTLKTAISTHAKTAYPAECCGLIVQIHGKPTYQPCINIALTPNDQFEIDPADWVRLSELGEIQAIVHSHPNGSAEPSEVDRAQMGVHGMDWVICGYGVHSDEQEYCEIKRHKPTSYLSPLVGREYYHGVQDCYSLVRDYYQRELDIDLPDFARNENWWEDENHEPLYQNNFEKAGFVQVHDLQKHDVILCRVGRTEHINHALVWLGDGSLNSEPVAPVVGDSLILHHPHGALSRREVFGDSWRRRVSMVVRHRSLSQVTACQLC